MSKDLTQVGNLLDDLTEYETVVLADLIAGLNRLEMEDGSPKYTGDEISLIGRFVDLDDEDDAESDSDDDDVDADDEQPDADGTAPETI